MTRPCRSFELTNESVENRAETTTAQQLNLGSVYLNTLVKTIGDNDSQSAATMAMPAKLGNLRCLIASPEA